MCSAKSKGKETPLMKQYNQIKAQYPGALLLFRVGDFYETFDADARTASAVLGIVLTKRSNGAASEMDLAGFPHHSLDTYLPKLVRAGYRVAVCDQLEDPKQTKTVVKRGVTELVTPGVSYNDKILESRESNYLASLVVEDNKWGLSLLDISTGDFQCTEGDISFIQKLLNGFKPAEWIFPKQQKSIIEEYLNLPNSFQMLDDWVYQTEYAEEKLTRQLKTQSLKGFGIHTLPLAIISAGAALQYLENTHHYHTEHISTIHRLEESKYVWLDGFTIRNLELVRPIYPEGKSLLDIIDNTSTPMGGRLLRNWILLPLKDLTRIEERQSKVNEFFKDNKLEDYRELMSEIGDLQRLSAKISLKRVNPRELLQLARSLGSLQELLILYNNSKQDIISKLSSKISDSSNIIYSINNHILEDSPINVSKGGVFKSEVNEELKELRDLSTGGKDKLVSIQQREIQATGISSLKIGFNNVFGYYLEVTHAHKDKVPEDWIRKQTLTNAERYITPELKAYEEKILSAEDKIHALEMQLWEEYLQTLSELITPVQTDALTLAQWDILMGFAEMAKKMRYTRPQLNEGQNLNIKDGRHPVIEALMPPDDEYVPNSIEIRKEDQRIVIITGPNMSGKSAILRQVALTVILAQIGSFVPCKSAEIGIVDKVYTRVGASDNISLGESTFMVEMSETASILNNLSERSLVLLDEIGRGTSTYDGVSLAWSIVEFLQSHPAKPKTLFATHYHELNELENKLDAIKNFHVAVKQQGSNIVFLRKLAAGGSEHSFGIHVAQLAGIPNTVLMRSAEILENLESSRLKEQNRNQLKQTESKPVYQMSMFQTEDPRFKRIQKELKSLDINQMSPIEALLALQKIQNIAKDN